MSIVAAHVKWELRVELMAEIDAAEEMDLPAIAIQAMLPLHSLRDPFSIPPAKVSFRHSHRIHVSSIFWYKTYQLRIYAQYPSLKCASTYHTVPRNASKFW